MAEQTEEMHTYHGNCHCGAFGFVAKLPELRDVHACNCSICVRFRTADIFLRDVQKSYLWALPASSSQFSVEHGDESALTEYSFGKKKYTHKFCPTCGTAVLARAPGMIDGKELAINVRSFKGVDFNKLNIQKFDGAATQPAFEPPGAEAYPTLKTEVKEGEKLYQGSCHCGAVTYTVKHKPLEEGEVNSCNCSSCGRNGELWIYPLNNDATLKGKEALTVYEFGNKIARHLFCGTCGVNVMVEGETDALPFKPTNTRTMKGVDIEGLKIKKVDGWSMEPQYEV